MRPKTLRAGSSVAERFVANEEAESSILSRRTTHHEERPTPQGTASASGRQQAPDARLRRHLPQAGPRLMPPTHADICVWSTFVPVVYRSGRSPLTRGRTVRFRPGTPLSILSAWWNWQTRTLEGRESQDVQVRPLLRTPPWPHSSIGGAASLSLVGSVFNSRWGHLPFFAYVYWSHSGPNGRFTFSQRIEG